jgi:chitinase
VFISDATVVEGDAGTTNMVFNIAVSPPSGKPISFRHVTQSGTATVGSDFIGTNVDMILHLARPTPALDSSCAATR